MNKEELKKRALAFLKANPGEKEVFIIEGTVHMYSKKENALIQAGGDESKIERVSLEEEKPAKPAKSETPDGTWKVDELKAFAAEKNIVLDPKDNKEAILAKIAAASAPAQ